MAETRQEQRENGGQTTMMNEFEDRVVVVTGAAQGIGEALTRKLLAAGARVAALDAQRDKLALLNKTHNAGERLSVHGVDVSDAEAVNNAIAAAEDLHGPIDYLASVAGILQMGRITELSDNEWAHAMAVNATGPFNVARAVSKRMIERRRGAIVVVSSNAASTPRMAMGAYAASKAAASQMTRCLGLELAEYGIRCNIVSPGSTDTDMQRGMWSDASSKELVIAGSLETYKAGIPLGKIATADEVSEAILFLLSERASHITMHDLRIDGGATLGTG